MMMTPILPLPSPTPSAIAAEMSTTSLSTPIAATTTTTTTPPVALTGRSEKPERNLWREQEMLTVLQIIREKKLLPLLNDKTVRSEAVFRRVEKEMFDRGFRKKNFQQIWTKWKFLKSTYMTSRRVHQVPKIIPLEVYESLDELLTAEFQNDGSMSSYDGGDYDDGGGGIGNGNSNSNGNVNGNMMMSDICGVGGGGYEMMNASASTTGSNDGYLPVISNVQGSLNLSSSSTSTPTTMANTLFNGGRNYAADLNGFGGIGMRRNKFKNGFRSSFKHEEDTNGFGMQHPIFGYRLGVVKDEPIDDDYENNNNNSAADASFPHEHVHDEPSNSNSQQYPDVKPELTSPPPSPSPSSQSPSTQQEDDNLPIVPEISSLAHSQHSTNGDSMDGVDSSMIDPLMPPLHRYTPPTYLPLSTQSDTPHPPPLKQIPFMKIQLPSKPQISQMAQVNHHLHHNQHQVDSQPIQNEYRSKKIPVLTLRKRKKRLHIPDLSEGTQSPAPSSKNSKISDEDDPRESPPETSRIPFVTYGKAMREMSSSLREIQREMIDDFFKQQMDLAKSEHEFQKQQDAMLLRCFEDQTKLLLDGARRMFSTNQELSMARDE
ncbi:bromodomain-containing protein DDB_G0270170 [Eupeodes corollae]|uniref:bromodomain-containing protein DDB_G0270170 n=1 Tax=Eupeodes corollae TaxID=290404 RepID=UPI0024903642|nr:bromodomain-containing protein DDB_G0270170 [Eupeodes corollae]